jgi:hypothetical protein
MFCTPGAKPSDGGAVGAAGVVGARGEAVLRGGLGRVGKAGDRGRQFDDRLEVEPVRHLLGCGAGGSGAASSVGVGRNRLRQNHRDDAILGGHHRRPEDTALCDEPCIGVFAPAEAPAPPFPPDPWLLIPDFVFGTSHIVSAFSSLGRPTTARMEEFLQLSGDQPGADLRRAQIPVSGTLVPKIPEKRRKNKCPTSSLRH